MSKSISPVSSYNLLSRYFVFLCFYSVSCLYGFSSSEQCTNLDDCKCKFPNGSIIDISSLGYRNHKPRWFEIPVKNSTVKFSYNPCFKFNSGPSCHNVAVCQHVNNEEHNCGDSARFLWNATSKTNYVLYVATPGGEARNTSVNLICSPEAWEPELTVIGEVVPLHYAMNLKTRCACSDLCRESTLSTGSVLVIIFMIFVALYLVLGIIHSSLTRGAHGWELIPHYEFWADFPLLVRDGCVFVVSGCKADTAYEQI